MGLEIGIENELIDILHLNPPINLYKISEYLNIGKPNAKTFLKRINLIQISFEELKELCQKLEM